MSMPHVAATAFASTPFATAHPKDSPGLSVVEQGLPENFLDLARMTLEAETEARVEARAEVLQEILTAYRSIVKNRERADLLRAMQKVLARRK